MNNLLQYDLGKEITAFSTKRNQSPQSKALTSQELPFPVLQPHQVHDDKIVIVDRRDMTREDLQGVDGLITNLKDMAIGVRTADCVPVLMYDEKHGVVAAVHSGWRGTVKRISQKALQMMAENFSVKASDVKAVIGPSIGPESFQVGEEVVEEFRKAGFPMEDISGFFGEKIPDTMNGGWHIDLWKANKWLLTEMGLSPENIQISGICTYSRNDLFFSARQEGTKCGRIINAIKMNS